jgi:ATP-dependent Clp protease adaptor protein ClpS
MATITKTKESEKLEEILSSPYVIILHNDDYNSFDWVIECLMKICKHELEQANQCAHIVHFRGKCDVKRGDQETLTKMYDKLKSAGLTVTMEMC